MKLTASETGAERFDKVDRAWKPETEDQENAGISGKLVYKGYGVRWSSGAAADWEGYSLSGMRRNSN